MRFFLFIVLGLQFLLLSSPVRAQNLMAGFSVTEKVGFAFYHLINRDPPVEDWIMIRDDYDGAMPAVRLQILDNDRIRLREGYASYATDRELVSVKVNLLYDVMDNPDYKEDPSSPDGGLIKRVKIHFPLEGQAYFPFQIGKFWVGVVPQDVDRVFTRDMTAKQYFVFCSSIASCQNFENRTVSTVIVMKPVKADITKPFIDGGVPIWLMLADVGALYIKNNTQDNTWSYTAPWYDDKQSQDLLSLLNPRL